MILNKILNTFRIKFVLSFVLKKWKAYLEKEMFQLTEGKCLRWASFLSKPVLQIQVRKNYDENIVRDVENVFWTLFFNYCLE